MNYWTPYLKSIPSFTYEFSFKVNTETYKERILAFDSVFLKNGLELGLCIFDGLASNEAIDRYLLERNEFFWLESNNNNSLNLFDLTQSKSFTGTRMRSIYLPYFKSNEVVNEKIDNRKGYYDVLTIDGFQDLRENELIEETCEENEIILSISSSSNIWWDEFDLTIVNGERWGDRVLFNPPIDNRSCSYRITPRFNSLIREISNIINDFEGKILLEEFNSRYVTERGILVDGKVIYQEDIMAGTIDLLEIDKKSYDHNQSIKQVKI